MRRSAKKTGLLLAWALFGLLIGLLIGTLVYQIYELLFEYFPEVFPLYNPVFDSLKYERFTLIMAFITASLTLASAVYLCQRFNNDRFEFIITKTDGLYKIRSILKTYVSIFAVSDLISSVICATVLTVPIYFIPKGFFTKSTFVVDLLTPFRTIVDGIGVAAAAAAVCAIVLLSHVITLPLVLKFYRAKWLTGFAEGTV